MSFRSPVKSLLEYGALRPGRTFFDYGCGQGSDVRGLQALGYQAEGWDQVFRRDVGKREADIVNFGYVLNVIEDPAERVSDGCTGPSKGDLLSVLDAHGLNGNLNKRRGDQYVKKGASIPV